MNKFKKIIIFALISSFIISAFFVNNSSNSTNTGVVKAAPASYPEHYCNENNFFNNDVKYYLRDNSTTIYLTGKDGNAWPTGCNEFKYAGESGGAVWDAGFFDAYFVSTSHNNYVLHVNIDTRKSTNDGKGSAKVQRLIWAENSWGSSETWPGKTAFSCDEYNSKIADHHESEIAVKNMCSISTADGGGTSGPYVLNWNWANFIGQSADATKDIFEGKYDIKIEATKTTKPYIIISKRGDNKPPADYTFELTDVAERFGPTQRNAYYYYFTNTKPTKTKIAIRFRDGALGGDEWNGRPEMITMGTDIFDDDTGVDGVELNLNDDNFVAFLRLAYAKSDIDKTSEKWPTNESVDTAQMATWKVKMHSLGYTLLDVLENVSKIINKAIADIVNALTKFIGEKILIIGNMQETGHPVIAVWQKVRMVSNVMLILGLLFIAFANVARWQLDYYTAKALLPRLALAAVFINFSLLMTQAIMDLGNILTAYFIHGVEFVNIIPASALGGGASVAGTALIGYAIFMFWQVVLIAALIALVTLVAILVFRVVLIWVLAILSPLVFLFGVLPFTRGLTSIWWNYLVKYVFMGAVVAIILNVASELSKWTPTGTNPTFTDEILRTVAIIALIIAAALSPIILGDKLAKAISGKIGDWSRGAKKSAMAKSRGGAKLAAGRKEKEDKAFSKAVGRRSAGMLGWKSQLATRLHDADTQRSIDKKPPLGYLAQKLKQRYTIGETQQKLIQQKAEGMDFNMAQDTYHRLKAQGVRTGAQELEYAAATYKLVEGGEGDRLALTRAQQARGVEVTDAEKQIPKFSDPFMVSTAIKANMYHVIANPKIRAGIMSKLHTSPEGITKIASETIARCNKTDLNTLFATPMVLREMMYNGDSRRIGKLMPRFKELDPDKQLALRNIIKNDQEMFKQYNKNVGL